jgi:hypothetical protein
MRDALKRAGRRERRLPAEYRVRGVLELQTARMTRCRGLPPCRFWRERDGMRVNPVE